MCEVFIFFIATKIDFTQMSKIDVSCNRAVGKYNMLYIPMQRAAEGILIYRLDIG